MGLRRPQVTFAEATNWGLNQWRWDFTNKNFGLIKPKLYPKLGDLSAKNIVDLIYAGRWIETRANLEGELLPNVRSRSIPRPHRRSIPVFWAPFVALKSRGCGGQDLLSSWVVESSGLLVGSHAGLAWGWQLEVAGFCRMLEQRKVEGHFRMACCGLFFLSNQITSNYNPEATQSLTHTLLTGSHFIRQTHSGFQWLGFKACAFEMSAGTPAASAPATWWGMFHRWLVILG